MKPDNILSFSLLMLNCCYSLYFFGISPSFLRFFLEGNSAIEVDEESVLQKFQTKMLRSNGSKTTKSKIR